MLTLLYLVIVYLYFTHDDHKDYWMAISVKQQILRANTEVEICEK